MKKFFLVLLFGFLLSGNAFAEKINLSCKENILDTILSFTINTDNKTVSTQGSNYDPYLYSNGVFTFLMRTEKNDYFYRLNRNTGILIVKVWTRNEEEFEKMLNEIYVKMLQDGKTTKDSEYVLNLVVETYSKKEDYTDLKFTCKKTEPKF